MCERANRKLQRDRWREKKLVTFGGSWPDKPLSLSLSISSTLSFLLRRSLPEDKTGFRRESVHHFSMPAHGSHCHYEKINLWHHQPTGIKRVTGAGPAIWCIRGLRWTACRFYKLNRTLSSQDGKLGCAGGDEIWFNQLTIHFKCIR